MCIRDRCYNVGLDVGWGTFSDIVELKHLGCIGINFGIGYQLEHTPHCYAMKRTIEKQLARVLQFYRKYKSVAMPFYNEPSHDRYGRDRYGYDIDDDDGYTWAVDDDTTECSWCGTPLATQYFRHGYIVCVECADYIDTATS